MAQIGIIGSSWTLIGWDVLWIASMIGDVLWPMGHTLVIWVENDCKNLAYYVAASARRYGCDVLGVCHNKYKPDTERRHVVTHVVCTGMERGWGREFVFVNSCDLVIALWWWSGTLNEITIAYQSRIPVICIKWTGWRSDKLADTYLDERWRTDSSVHKIVWSDIESLQTCIIQNLHLYSTLTTNLMSLRMTIYSSMYL